MARGRLKLAFNENNSSRKTLYNKRKKTLVKKVEELSTLCGVEACAIVYNSFDKEPEIWPPSHSAVQGILQKFKDLSVDEKNHKKMNQESFTRQRISKLGEQLKKLKKENRQKEIKIFVQQCLAGEAQQTFNIDDLKEMRSFICDSLKSISQKIETLQTLQSPGAPPGMTATLQSAGGEMMPTVDTTLKL